MVEKYDLISENDRIAVELSEDQNGRVLLECLLKYQQESNVRFQMEYFVEEQEDGITSGVKELIESYRLHTYKSMKAEDINELYKAVEDSGCNLVAFPNTYNDIVNLTFMTLAQRKQAVKILPKSEAKQNKTLGFIRPICMIEEKEIAEYLKESKVEMKNSNSVFHQWSYVEEGVDNYKKQAAQYHFSVYECV